MIGCAVMSSVGVFLALYASLQLLRPVISGGCALLDVDEGNQNIGAGNDTHKCLRAHHRQAADAV